MGCRFSGLRKSWRLSLTLPDSWMWEETSLVRTATPRRRDCASRMSLSVTMGLSPYCHPERRTNFALRILCGVEGHLLPSTLLGVGVLRVRGCFAKRSSHFAQDDKNTQDDSSYISNITGMIRGRFCVCLET